MNGSIFRGVDFTGTDWGERNKDIAARLGITPGLVAAARRHFGMVLTPRIDWSDVDFSRPSKEIAAEKGCSVTAVNIARRSAGMAASRLDWSELDWSMDNVAIARELGCTPSAVLAARLRITGKHSQAVGGRPSLPDAAERVRDRAGRAVNVLLSPELFACVEAEAKRTGKTKPEVIREAVREKFSRS